VVKDGDYKVAQYGQWDGYPGGQGTDVLNFLRNMNREVFEDRVNALSWLTDEESKMRWVECGADPDSDMVGMDVADKHREAYPESSRDTGADVLKTIRDSERPLKLKDSRTFAGDSLFCEWAYVVDLDTNVLEVYRGFNKERLQDGERFKHLENEPEIIEIDGEAVLTETQYYPVSLVASYDIDNLPSAEDFCEKCDPDEEEE